MLLPTPAVARRAAELARAARLRHASGSARPPRSGCSPPGCAERAGIRRAVALTHGHEVGWAALPGARGMLRRIGRGVDVVTYLGEYTRVRLARALRRADRRCERLAPGVDVDAFHPDVDGAAVRAELRADRPAGGRLRVPAGAAQGPGHADPGAAGDPPPGARRRAAAGRRRARTGPTLRAAGPADRASPTHVVFTGSVPWAELPAHYAAGDVFAMPCRTRRRGLDVEGLGIVYLEASATGLPVVAGDSGGAPDAVREGETGLRGAAAATSPRSPTGSPRCSPTGTWPGSWARPAGPGSSGSGAGTPRPQRMAALLAG